MVGTTTIIKQDVTESGTRFGSLRNVSRTYHEVSRPLLTPDEIMDLKKPRAATMPAGSWKAARWWCSPPGSGRSSGTQILYFIDPVFRQRALIPAPPTGSTVSRPKIFRVV